MQADGAAVEAEAGVPAAGTGGELLLHHQPLIEPAGATHSCDLHEQVERLGLAGRRLGIGRGQVVAPDRSVAGARILELHAARGALLRLLRPHASADARVGRKGAIGGFCQRLDLGRIDIASDNDDGVVGRVEALVEGQRVLTRQLLHLVHPADDGDAVGVVLVQRRRHLLCKDARGDVLGAHAALLDDHLALGLDLPFAQSQVHHPVGFHLHERPQAVLGDALVVACVVGAGEGVVLAAEARDDSGEFPGRELLRRLEHQVLEEMGDARYARRLVGGAYAEVHHVGDDRRSIVRHDHENEAVGQFELADAVGGIGLGSGKAWDHEHECEKEEGEALAWFRHGSLILAMRRKPLFSAASGRRRQVAAASDRAPGPPVAFFRRPDGQVK